MGLSVKSTFEKKLVSEELQDQYVEELNSEDYAIELEEESIDLETNEQVEESQKIDEISLEINFPEEKIEADSIEAYREKLPRFTDLLYASKNKVKGEPS